MADERVIPSEEQRRILNQHLAQTIAHNQTLRQQIISVQQQNKRLKQKAAQHFPSSESSQEELRLRQENELLREELKQMQERCSKLKRQQSLTVPPLTPKKQPPQPAAPILPAQNPAPSVHECAATEKLAEAEKRISILTNYIQLKQKQKVASKSNDTFRLSTCAGGCQERIQTLEKEKRRLEANVEKCKKVVEESESYYLREIQKMQDEVALLEEKCRILKKQKDTVSRDYEELQRCFEQKLREAEMAQMFATRDIENKYENLIDNLKLEYERNISCAQEQAQLAKTFLEQAHPGIADFRPYTPARFAMVESKMTGEKSPSSMNSLRITGGSFAISIKEELSRKSRQDDLAKNVLELSSRTPLKKSLHSYSQILLDRTNNI